MTTAERRKAEHKCEACGGTDERIMAGYAICGRCSERAKEKRRERKRAHLCISCGEPLPDGYEKSNCEACLSYRGRLLRLQRAELHAAGRCVICGAKNDDTEHKTCKACRAKISERAKRRRAYLIANGLCVECGKPVDTEYQKCFACRKKEAERKKLEKDKLWED